MKPRFLPKLNHRLVMGWLFILSIPGIILSYFLFPTFLLWALVFFFAMLFYQAGEVFYDEHQEKKRIAEEIKATARLSGTTILDPVRTERLQITKHLCAFYSIHTRAITFQSKEDRKYAEKLYHQKKWVPPSFNWCVDGELFQHLNQNLKA